MSLKNETSTKKYISAGKNQITTKRVQLKKQEHEGYNESMS